MYICNIITPDTVQRQIAQDSCRVVVVFVLAKRENYIKYRPQELATFKTS